MDLAKKHNNAEVIDFAADNLLKEAISSGIEGEVDSVENNRLLQR